MSNRTMTGAPKRDLKKIAARQAREDFNIFSRLPAIYAASRVQGLNLLQKGGGISILEWRVLWDLSEVGPMTIRDLAAIQRADHSLLSRALPKMKDKGFVKMHRDSDDGRQIIVAIAPKGRAAFEIAAPFMANRRSALKIAFSPQEIEDFVGYLDRLEEFLRQPVDNFLENKDAS